MVLLYLYLYLLAVEAFGIQIIKPILYLCVLCWSVQWLWRWPTVPLGAVSLHPAHPQTRGRWRWTTETAQPHGRRWVISDLNLYMYKWWIQQKFSLWWIWMDYDTLNLKSLDFVETQFPFLGWGTTCPWIYVLNELLNTTNFLKADHPQLLVPVKIKTRFSNFKMKTLPDMMNLNKVLFMLNTKQVIACCEH